MVLVCVVMVRMSGNGVSSVSSAGLSGDGTSGDSVSGDV